MDKYSIYLVLIFVVFAGAGGLGIFLYLRNLKKKGKLEKKELEEVKEEQDEVLDTMSGLTSISGVRSVLDYLADNLQKLAFPKVLILIINKKKRTLDAEVALGFKEDLDLKKIRIPISTKGGTLGQTLLKNKFFVVQDENELHNSLEFKGDLQLGSFMSVPIVKKSNSKCWEIFHCNRTSCPAYENDDPRCWTIPDTRCISHLTRNYDEKIFSDPNDRLEACLDCERFETMGVILVGDREFVKFKEDDKKLFRAFAYQAGSKLERSYLLGHIEEREREITRRMYELSILKELGDRVGYSLNTQKIADIITGSLKKLIDYSTTSYMLIDPNQKKLLFKCQLEEAVSRGFIDTIRDRMLAGLSALLNEEFNKSMVDESLTGTIIDDISRDPVRSFFNIPLTVGDKVVGMLNVASTRPGLYKEDEMTILYKITAQASNAVTRLQLVLDSEQRKLNAMVSSMADGVLMIDKDNKIYVINPIVKTMLGLEKDDISIFDIIDALANKVDFRTKFEESLKLSRLIVEDDVYLQHRYLRILFSPVKDRKGEVLGTVIIFHDITHDKEIEKIKEDFNSMMVHDLRSPLNGIRLLAEMLQSKKVPTKEQTESIKLIHDNSSSMLEMVNDLLDVAKLESGKFIVEKQPDDLIALIDDRIAFFKTIADEKKIKLLKEIEPGIPKIAFDRKEMAQVLNNYLSNAIKFTGEGGNVKIQILQYRENDNIEKKAKTCNINWLISNNTKNRLELNKEGIICAITDNGSGIAKDQISKLFNKFEQADGKQKSEAKGTGLGLVIAKGIVEAHGGKVGVESVIDRGSTFFFVIPIE